MESVLERYQIVTIRWGGHLHKGVPFSLKMNDNTYKLKIVLHNVYVIKKKQNIFHKNFIFDVYFATLRRRTIT